VGVRGDPQGPPQDLRQGRRRGSGRARLYGGRSPFVVGIGGCPLRRADHPRVGWGARGGRGRPRGAGCACGCGGSRSCPRGLWCAPRTGGLGRAGS
jgi:hypothetical protein